ncbi:FtsQ-type POTRA domain-containing protein [Actinoplanes sp. LDG1-06]|uniref:FtsQ-type POTRA domain-containing protein n=1 Tax=Paractinoplanes ovalisporus TaxID=2810368 RepID=A0ABS2A630_9ACTN|nr:FtsQ-type POTRA domain-containing protein [Actinoplanes ovalisporus]MBM2615271.1 FtsQ-type POTRA domain-containing protein [Actinoplanes ovalisporus]
MSGGRNWRLVRADTDAVPSSARRFMARARQRRMRAALPWAVAAGVLLVIGGLAWLVYGTSVLGVREVRVVGVQFLAPPQIEQAANVPDAEPLARVDLDGVRSRVREIPAVERVVVRRSWPSTLVVEVVERTPVAAVPQNGEFTLIDRAGVAYRTVKEPPSGLPLVRVDFPGPSDVNTKSALTVLAALSDELREQVVAVSVAAPAQIRLELRKERVVVWGDDTQSDTKSQVATALLKQKGNEIDVSAPTVVTIR